MERKERIEEFFRSLKKRKSIAEEEFEGLKYYRLKDDTRSFLRGTVYAEGELIVGYPRIARILSFYNGVKNHIKEPFWVEEKADGYNVRVAKIADKIVAFTRGGYICPFTTDRLQDLGDFESFFKDHPNMIIAGEVVGRNTPYSELFPAYVDEEIAFFAFDLFSKDDWRFVSPTERYTILSRYEIRQVEHWGPFKYEDMDRIKEILRFLDERVYEGVVIKGSGGRRVKYVLPHINIRDVLFSSHLIAELPSEFFTQRIIRMVLSGKELGIDFSDKDFCDLGKAFISGFSKAFDSFIKENKVKWVFELRFRNPKRAELFIDQVNKVSKTVRVKIISMEPDGEYWKVKFEKIFMKSTGYLASVWKGSLIYD